MFEDPRDHEPPVPSPAVRQHVRDAAHRRRRRRVTVIALAMTLAVVLAGGAWFVRSQLDEIDRVTVGGLAQGSTAPDAETSIVAPTTSASNASTTIGGRAPLDNPINVLVVALDRRDEGGHRADAIVIVRIDPIAGRLAVLGVSRDHYVPIGKGTRLIGNLTRNVDDDPTLLVTTLSDIVDVPIHHYIAIETDDFVRAVDLTGGVDISFDRDIRDPQTGFAAQAGCVHLDGAAAWSYARSRRVETRDPTTSEWEPDEARSAGRVDRQLDLVGRIVGSVLAHDYSIDERVALITDVLDGVTTDAGMRTGLLLDAFETARSIGAEEIGVYNLADATVSLSIQLDPDSAAAVGRAFVEGTPFEVADGAAATSVLPSVAACPPR